jgi:23S rRNA (cytidine1920-2'-O)/16S rRNA (cytidine1409-2'-O)-methyltransferase
MQRIDTFLVEHGLAESREQAKRLILAGAVTVNGNAKIKPGQRIPADAEVVVQEQQKYVSRGGFKLEKALFLFDVDVKNRVALDVGASTGGFTDCLLQHGAKFVYAVDVGYGQLAWKLQTHPQVQSIEKTNIRHLTPTLLNRGEGSSPKHDSDDLISIAVIDVSFISLRTVLPSVIKILAQQNSCQSSVASRQLRGSPCQNDNLLTENRKVFRRKTELTTDNYDIIALLKPQFEAGKIHVKKGGVVADKQVHIETIENLSVFVTDKLGTTVRGLTYSPIHKDIGNIEYLLWLTIEPDTQERTLETDVQPQQPTAEIVAEAHNFFQS